MASVTIKTAKSNLPPEAVITFLGGSIAPKNINAESYLVQLDASASNDPDGTIVTYIWERKKAGGSWIQFASTTSPFTSNLITLTATYEYRVRVKDNTNLEDTSGVLSVIFTESGSVDCIAKINGQEVDGFTFGGILNGSFYLDSSQSSAGESTANITSRYWELGSVPSASEAVISSPSGQSTVLGPLNVQGTYNVTLYITSSNGSQDSVSIKVIVN